MASGSSLTSTTPHPTPSKARSPAHEAILPCLAFANTEQTEQAVRTYIDLFRTVFGHAGELARTTFSPDEIDIVQRVHGLSLDQLPGPAGAVNIRGQPARHCGAGILRHGGSLRAHCGGAARQGSPDPHERHLIAAQGMETGADLLSFDAHFGEVDGLAWVDLSS